MLNLINLSILVFIYVLLIFFASSHIKKRDSRLYRLLLACFLLHMALLCIVQYVLSAHPDPRRTFFGNDGEYYSMHARIIAAILTNRPLSYIAGLEAVNPWVSGCTQLGMIPDARTYQIGYITYFYGILYSIFGYYPLIINLYNITLHLLSGILVFKIGKGLFNENTGYMASALFLFNPTLFYYTTIKLAEASYIFIICLIVYLILKLNIHCLFYAREAASNALKGSNKLRPLGVHAERIVILASALFFLRLLKPFLFLPLIASILSYSVMLAALHFKKIKALFLLLVFSILYFNQKLLGVFNQLFYSLAASHKAFFTSGGQVYKLLKYGDNFTSYTFFQKLAYLFSGWEHFIAEPSRYVSLPCLLYYPFKIVFIILFILAMLGMAVSVKAKKTQSIFLILYLFFAGTVVAGASGNSGTMLRHRDAITFVVFIFAAYYIQNIAKMVKGHARTY